MRLDGFIARSTTLSRKEAKRAIAFGRVKVAGVVVKNPALTVQADDLISLDREELSQPGELYLMLYKPAGMLSATSDANQPVVTDLLPQELSSRVHLVGRLDQGTTGLVLLTSDGQWSHRITSPRHTCPKTYRVSLAEPLPESARHQLETGVTLKSETSVTCPARVTCISPTEIDLTIHEGRYHQVKRMLAAVGNHVTALHRHRIGPVSLDSSLAPGEFRHLTGEEIRGLEFIDARNDRP